MDQATALRNMVKSQDEKEQKKNAARVITVTSGKGGVGKSNMSVNLAIQFARMNKRVIILDADFGLANVEVMFGIRPKYNLSDLMFNNKSLRDIICKGPENIGIISGGSGIQEMANLTDYQIKHLTSKLIELDELADIIIIDTGAGINNVVIELSTYSSDVILVTSPEPTSITDAYALLKSLNKKTEFDKTRAVQMLTNRVESVKEGQELYGKLNTVVQKFLEVKLDFLGAVPFDMNVSKAVMCQNPFTIAFPNTVATKAVEQIVKKLSGDTTIAQKEKKGIVYLFSSFIHKNS